MPNTIKTINEEAWEEFDTIEYERLVSEMRDDARWQLQIFTFALTATALILGVRAPNASQLGAAIPGNLFPLAPLVILIPSSLIILNRARTRNRKAAYMLSYLEAKQLRIKGFANLSLETVRARPDLPWETALHLLDRKVPHIPPALKYMVSCYIIIEWICVGLSLYFSATLLARGVSTSFALFVIAASIFRLVLLYKLKGKRSIQGYSKQWLEHRHGKELENCPEYLKTWIGELSKKANDQKAGNDVKELGIT
jgi:hypothetical protein